MVNTRIVDHYSVLAYGAIGDGNLHPLSERYATLVDAQAVYPAATALTEQIDRHAIQRAIDVCSAAGGGLVTLPPKKFRTDATITQKVGVSVKGVRAKTRVVSTSISFNCWRVNEGTYGDGTYIVASGRCEDISFEGPSALTYPSAATTAAHVMDNSTMFVNRGLSATNYPIGFDLINNNYNTTYYDTVVPRFKACELGINLRTGSQSGSDIHFFNSQIFAWQTSVAVSGGGGSYSFTGFQFGNNNSTTSDGTGVIMLGWDWVTQTATGTVGNTAFQNGGVEGPKYNWMIRATERVYATFRNVSFLAVDSTASKMLGFLKMTSASTSQIHFDGCGHGSASYYANDPFMVISGAAHPVYSEQGWRINYQGNALNTGARTCSGFGPYYGNVWWANQAAGGPSIAAVSYSQALAHWSSNGMWYRGSTAYGAAGTNDAVIWTSSDPSTAHAPLGMSPLNAVLSAVGTAITTGVKYAWTALRNGTFDGFSVTLATPQTSGSVLRVDVLKNGVSIYTTPITVDNTEASSSTAAVPAVFNGTAYRYNAGDIITVSITQVGTGGDGVFLHGLACLRV